MYFIYLKLHFKNIEVSLFLSLEKLEFGNKHPVPSELWLKVYKIVI